MINEPLSVYPLISSFHYTLYGLTSDARERSISTTDSVTRQDTFRSAVDPVEIGRSINKY